MDEIKDNFNLKVVTEVTEIGHLDRIIRTADILQIGSRNMQNLELLKEVSKTKFPIILKRHFGTSLRDFLGAAEHILVEGNENLILCERGVSIPHTSANLKICTGYSSYTCIKRDYEISNNI